MYREKLSLTCVPVEGGVQIHGLDCTKYKWLVCKLNLRVSTAQLCNEYIKVWSETVGR